MTRLAILFAALALTGCPQRTDVKRVEIYAFTAAPPSRTAQVTNTDTIHRVVLARGAALAVTSWTTCPNSPSTTLTASDPSVLGVHKIYRNGADNQFVIFGQIVGTTILTVANGCAQQVYEVTIAAE